MIIGTFTATKGGYVGKLTTLTHQAGLAFEAAGKGVDYRVTLDGNEVGAAWKRKSQAGKSYLSVKLDSPFLAAPINGALMEQDSGFILVWNRDEAKDSRAND